MVTQKAGTLGAAIKNSSSKIRLEIQNFPVNSPGGQPKRKKKEKKKKEAGRRVRRPDTVEPDDEDAKQT
jgi:starvation-inducible outer membrane lipoprotein